MYLFVQQPCTGKAPLEMIMPQVREMPFYKLVNDPFGCLLWLQKCQEIQKVAANEVKQCLMSVDVAGEAMQRSHN